MQRPKGATRQGPCLLLRTAGRLAPLSTGAGTSAPRSCSQEPHGEFSVTEHFRTCDLVTSVVSTTRKTKHMKCWGSAGRDGGDTWWSGRPLHVSSRICVPPPGLARPRLPQRAQPRLSSAQGVHGAPSLPPASRSSPYRCDPRPLLPLPPDPSPSPSIRCSWPHPHSSPASCFFQEARLMAPGFPVLRPLLPGPSHVLCHSHGGPHLDVPGTALSPSAHHLVPPSARP